MAKAAKKQTETPAAGHNVRDQKEMFAEQKFLNAVRQIKDFKSEIGEAMGEINEVYKSLKPLGFTKGDVKWAFELEEKDAGDVIATMQRRIKIAKMMGHGVARQFDMFDEDRTPLEDRAYDEGLAAGKMRKDAHNPYDMGSAAGQAWQRGLNDGTAFINQDLSDALDEPDGADPFATAAE